MKTSIKEQILSAIRKRHPSRDAFDVCEDLLSAYEDVLDITMGDIKLASGYDMALAKEAKRALWSAIDEVC